MSSPSSQDPNSPIYTFIDTQPASPPPNTPDATLSHFTTRQFVPTAITNANPVVVTIPNHDFQNGQQLQATKFIRIPFALATGMEQLNNQIFYVQQSTTNTFVLSDRNTIGIDGSGFTPYISGGQFTLSGPTLPIVNPQHFPPPGFVDSGFSLF